MKNIFVTFILIFCGAMSAMACESCGLAQGFYQSYHYKGNVKTVHTVDVCKYLDTLGNEKIDTTTVIFKYFDQKHRCMLFDYENRSTGSSAYQRHEIINGKYVLVESRGPFPMRNSIRVYSDKGELREEHFPNAVHLFNPNGRKYCTITYESIKSKRIANYEYVYYDKNGKVTATISMDRYYNVISRTRNVYDKRGNLTEVYNNGKRTSYHRYDSKSRPLYDSTSCGTSSYIYDSKGNILTRQNTNECIYAGENKVRTQTFEKYEYGKDGEKTMQEFVYGELDNIERYDKNGNRTYFRRYSCCPRIECKYIYNEKNKIIIDTTTYFNDDGTQAIYIQKYRNGEKDHLNREQYRNDTLTFISYYDEKKVDNKLISTKIEGMEDDSLKGKLNIDTLTSITTFDKNGKILTQCSYSKSEEANCSRYTYNDQGQLLSVVHDKEHQNDKHFYIDETRIDYQYDEHHNLVSETHRNGDEVVLQITNHYDATNHLVDSKTLRKDNGYMWEKYDKVGNMVEYVNATEGILTTSSIKETIVQENPADVQITTYTYYDE